MLMSCDINGTKCKRFRSDEPKSNDTVLGFILGSIALFIFLILLFILIYGLCGKQYVRNLRRIRFRSSNSKIQNSEQINNIQQDQQSIP
ncbi:hypothetical protein I4U23_006935 [Adineta vaga]|nr:hypothetical protein I4U23_006935 [Adineta vaga]